MANNADPRRELAAGPIVATPADPTVSVPKPVASPARSKPSRLLLLLLAFAGGGIGSLMLLAATRSPAAPPSVATTSADDRVATTHNTNDAAPRATAEPSQNVSLPHWVASRLPRRQGFGTGAIVFELAADADVEVWHKRVRPVLSVRCAAQTMEVFVMTYSAAAFEKNSKQHTVQVGFDDGDAANQMWESSVNHDALFAPDGNALATQIAVAHSMSFAFTPFNTSPARVNFNVSGLGGSLASAVKTCGWKP